MLGDKLVNAPMRFLLPGKQLAEDALIQVQEVELFSRNDYDQIAAVGWNAFWREQYPKVSGKPLGAFAKAQSHLMQRYREEIEICESRGIPVLLGVAVDSVFMA